MYICVFFLSLETDPIYVIVEYMSRGDLKTLLGSCKTAVMDSAPTDLPGLKENPSKTFVKFAKDVASGMEFLSSQNVTGSYTALEFASLEVIKVLYRDVRAILFRP